MQLMDEQHQKQETAVALQNLYRAMNSRRQGEAKGATLSRARLSILQLLTDNGPQSLSQLAGHRHVSAATMSKLVSSLIAEGLALRANSKSDRRSIIVMVTGKGKKLVAAEKAQELILMESIIAGLSDSEQSQANAAISLVHNIMNHVATKLT